MKLLKAGYVIEEKIGFEDVLKHIEKIGRTCYKSEDKINDDSAVKFVNGLVSRGHEAMVEHYAFVSEITAPLYNDMHKMNPKYIHLTATNINGRTRHIMSGSSRGFKDLLKHLIKDDRNKDFSDLLKAVISAMVKQTGLDVLFQGIDYNIYFPVDSALRVLNPAEISKLTREEKLQHEYRTVRFTCDRGVSHEIVRHRDASFAQESTRYCNYSNDKFGNQINVVNIAPGIALDTKMNKMPSEVVDKIIAVWTNAMVDAEKHYDDMIELGATPQMARGVLPNSLKTEIVVTMHLAEWYHFFKLRTEIVAHPQMREVAVPLLTEFKFDYTEDGIFSDIA